MSIANPIGYPIASHRGRPNRPRIARPGPSPFVSRSHPSSRLTSANPANHRPVDNGNASATHDRHAWMSLRQTDGAC